MIKTNTIIQHDVTKDFPLPDSCIDVVITSPPYWGLRDYGVDGQIGLEKHPQEYVDKLVGVCREIKRVLKSSGSFYLNLGDTYCGSGKGYASDPDPKWKKARDGKLKPSKEFNGKWLQPKQLMLIPVRVAIALQDDGWVLRNDIIWHKPNPMPSSVKDRLNNTFEHVFHFVKSRKYYYDLDSIREPHKVESFKRVEYGFHENKQSLTSGKGFSVYQKGIHPEGKNPGDTIEGGAILGESGAIKVPGGKGWTKKIPGGGNACSKDPRWCPPEGKNPGDTLEWNWRAGMNRDETEIIRVRINLPSQKDFVDYLKPLCKEYEEKLNYAFGETCWRHWIRYDDSGFSFPSIQDWNILKEILDLDDTFDLTQTQLKYNSVDNNPLGKAPGDFWDITTQPFTSYSRDLEHFAVFPKELIIKPLKASCPSGGVVLDPFCGRGTVGRVAKELGLNYVLFDISPDYCELARLYVNGQKRKLIKNQGRLET